MQLSLLEDRLEGGSAVALDARPRVVYVVCGAVQIESDDARHPLREGEAWYSSRPARIRAGTPAQVWSWELRPAPTAGACPRHKLSHAIEMPEGGALLRADRVDFPPRGIAYTHTHQGPGIRVLLHGRFRVETGGHTIDLEAGDPWFERGPDPVYAEVVGDQPASFVRVMVLPAVLLGQSSIRYVKPEDLERPKSQRYTILVDAPIAS